MIGDRIRRVREQKGYTQAILAEKAGDISKAAVSAWEKNISKPDIDKIIPLCEALNVTPNYLLDYAEHNTNQEGIALDSTEKDIINDIRLVDEAGKERIINTIMKEKERCSEGGGDAVFISKNDLEYAISKNKMKKLAKKRKEQYLGVEYVAISLRHKYGYRVSIGDVAMAFSGIRVPTMDVCDCIEEILEPENRGKG